MNAINRQFREQLEAIGFEVSMVRRVRLGTEIRAYVGLCSRFPDVNEVRMNPRCPHTFHCYQYRTKPNGYTQYDAFLGTISSSGSGNGNAH